MAMAGYSDTPLARKLGIKEGHLLAVLDASDAEIGLTPNGSLWVAWPKTTARKRFGIVSDITEDVVRAVAFPQGFVDTKVCAIDELWSGLRCVLRLENRPKPTKGGGVNGARRR